MTDTWLWVVTIGAIVAVFAFDFIVVVRKPHEPTFKESIRWTLFYVALAAVFGLSMIAWKSTESATEFFAGYVTEWSLSVDNLFVFLVILTRFVVPEALRQRVLLVGVGIALVLRGIFIALGAAAIENFTWVFYVFGFFLVWTAITLARDNSDAHGDAEYQENAVTRLVRRVVPTTDGYRGAAVFVKEAGRRMATPLLIVMIAIGSTDVLFALDSIPAIFGLTEDPYIVFTANAFALMGLRQLFFVVEGLLERLIYLSYGLAVILAFIGIKLIMEALHTNSVPWINGGEPFTGVPEIETWVSLLIILGVLVVSAAVSLIVSGRRARTSESAGEGA